MCDVDLFAAKVKREVQELSVDSYKLHPAMRGPGNTFRRPCLTCHSMLSRVLYAQKMFDYSPFKKYRRMVSLKYFKFG